MSLELYRWLCRKSAVLAAALLLVLAPAQAAETWISIHTDIAGSPVAATDESGNVIWRERYRPYGERARNETAAATNRQFFHGKALDVDTGLSYFGARYYDPVVGRFMGVDAVGFNEKNIHSFNRYAYGNNNPYRYLDPNGTVAHPVLLVLVGFGVWAGMELLPMPAVAPGSGQVLPTSMPDLGISAGTLGVVRALGTRLGNSVARNTASAAALRNQLLAEEIAAGHAFEKHVVRGAEFSGLGIRTRQQFQEHVENVLSNPSGIRYYRDGRTAYLHEQSGTVVVRNQVSGESTAFRPKDWKEFVSNLPARDTPF